MNVTVENLAPCKRLLRVEVDAATVDAAFERITQEILRHAKLPGFRPGKAPRDRVVKLYDEQITSEVKRKVFGDSLRTAVQEHKLRIVGTPEVEETQFGRGQAMQYTATVEIAPEFTLPEYKGLHVKVPRGVVTNADMEEALKILRTQRATYQDVQRAAQNEDFLVLNYQGAIDGKPLTDFAPNAGGLTKREKYWMQISPDAFLPGFPEQLTGAKAGDKKTVNVSFPANFVEPAIAGKQAVYEVEVMQVKERILPELNDDLAKLYGTANMEALREGVQRDLQNQIKYKQNESIRGQIVEALLNSVKIEDLPESVVLAETRNVVHNIVRENAERGISKEMIDEKKDEIFNVANTNAKDRVRFAYIVHQIADKENIKASQEEIAVQIQRLAAQHQIKPEKLAKQMQERGGFSELEHNIVTAKVMDFLQLHANMEEETVQTAPIQ